MTRRGLVGVRPVRLRCPRRHPDRCFPSFARQLAVLPRLLHVKPPAPFRKVGPPGGLRLHHHNLLAGYNRSWRRRSGATMTTHIRTKVQKLAGSFKKSSHTGQVDHPEPGCKSAATTAISYTKNCAATTRILPTRLNCFDYVASPASHSWRQLHF